MSLMEVGKRDCIRETISDSISNFRSSYLSNGESVRSSQLQKRLPKFVVF